MPSVYFGGRSSNHNAEEKSKYSVGSREKEQYKNIFTLIISVCSFLSVYNAKLI